jgi:hypothetical protein
MTLPPCPRCAAPVEPDWDWCQQCGYDPERLRPERVEVGASVGRPAHTDTKTRSRRERHRKKAAKDAAAPAATIDLRPQPPRRPTETVYGLLPYDDPSSVSPVEPDPPDNSERINRQFAIVALCVIIVGLAVLVVTMVLG